MSFSLEDLANKAEKQMLDYMEDLELPSPYQPDKKVCLSLAARAAARWAARRPASRAQMAGWLVRIMW